MQNPNGLFVHFSQNHNQRNIWFFFPLFFFCCYFFFLTSIFFFLKASLKSTGHYVEEADSEFSMHLPFLKSILPKRLWADLKGTNHYVMETAAPEWSFYSVFRGPKRHLVYFFFVDFSFVNFFF